MELESKSIIITGASSGIGAAVTLLFAEEGANLVIGARRSDELETLAETISRGNGRATCLLGDVRNEGYGDALVDLATKEVGGLDGAFDNAGLVGELGPVDRYGDRQLERCHLGQPDGRSPGREGSDTGDEEARRRLDRLHLVVRRLQQWRDTRKVPSVSEISLYDPFRDFLF
jgi:NAD(P)-dependent dehydrogenase (short-subunit alcohol dehydrogenase family)